MNHASLFSGIGGFDLAAKEVGWNNVFQCEIDPFCQSVLKYYFPKTVLYEDIKRTDFTSWKGKIDVLTGGFPCQPFSVAGQRKGADDNRYLWPEMLRVIRVEGLRQGREDKIHGFEFTSQTRDKIRRLITDTSGLRSHRFLYDKEDDKKQRSTENRLFKKYACRDWDGRGSTQWKSFPTQSPICRGNDGLPFNVDNLTIPYGKWRKESIKAYGNAIVPLIAVKIFEMINKIEGYEQQTTL